MNQKAKRCSIIGIVRLVRWVGAVITLAIVGFMVVYWMGFDGSETKTAESPPIDKALPNNSTVTKRESEDRAAKAHSSGGLTPQINKEESEELIGGMTLSELDAFHKNQMATIRKTLTDPKALVPLPFSDDRLPAITLGELDALHKRQTASSQIQPFDVVPTPWDASNDKSSMTYEQLDQLHKEQQAQSLASLASGTLPQISSDNQIEVLSLSEVEPMIRRQQLAAEFDEVDDTRPIVLPPSSDGPYQITNWDLIELHERQMDQLMKRTQPKGGGTK